LGTLLVPICLASAQAPSAPPATATRSPHGELAGECGTCHTPEGWTQLRDPLGFEHAGTGFPLVAAHAQAGCRDCHQSLVFSHVGTACADCHRDAHRGELGARCDACHVPESWTNRQEFFRVHNRTRFPLLPAHARLDCEACHRGQQPREFVGTPTDCVACHLADFVAADDPDHERLRFPRQCDQCHTMGSSSWEGGTFGAAFPHPDTFPLRAAHAAQPCGSCHGAGFSGTSRACVSCHRDDFDRARDPDHRAGTFPTDCQSCHGDAAWEPATFDHDRFFPLTRDHGGVACAACHVNPGNFRAFSCVTCHDHSREEMDDEHEDVRNYRYDSAACYSCHPRGVE
jgi:hypothetical protein